jgi:uncharacterized protein YndB with AHSA1/START domain
MRRREINITARTSGSPEVVYELLADGPTWPRWSPMETVTLEREGNPPPEGVSAIRVLKKGRTTGRDEILELVPNQRFRYASLSGLPVREYVGIVDLQPALDGGTTITWSASFFPTRPGTGWILQRGVRRFLGECARGLAEYAAKPGEH